MKQRMWWSLLVVVLVACGAWYFASGTPAPGSHGDMVYRDTLEREVRVPVPAKRIVTLTGADSEILLAIGVTPAGTAEHFGVKRDMTGTYASIPKVGSASSPNLEQVIALKPDLVIGSAVPFQSSLAPGLDAAGIPALFWQSERYDVILDHIRTLGVISGQEREAEKLVSSITSKVAALQARYKDRPRMKVLMISGVVGNYYAATSQTLVGDIVGHLPIENVADRWQVSANKAGMAFGYVPLDLEYISQADVDEIIIISMGSDGKEDSENFIRMFGEQPAWRHLRAVKEGRIRHLPGELFLPNPGVRVADSLEAAAHVIYDDGK